MVISVRQIYLKNATILIIDGKKQATMSFITYSNMT